MEHKPVLSGPLLVTKCRKCGRPMPKTAPVCAFCGCKNSDVLKTVTRVNRTRKRKINRFIPDQD